MDIYVYIYPLVFFRCFKSSNYSIATGGIDAIQYYSPLTIAYLPRLIGEGGGF